MGWLITDKNQENDINNTIKIVAQYTEHEDN